MRQFMMKLKMVIFIFLYALFGRLALSEDNIDIAQQSERLSLKYTKGNVLIYDCDDKHWVCTDVLEEKSCLSKREQVTLDKNQYYSCVVFKTFKLYENCVKEQQRLTDHSVHVLFCTNSKFKS